MTEIRIAGIKGMSKFKLDTRKMEKVAKKVAQSALTELYSNIVVSTPVDTGRLKGNWQIGANFVGGETGRRDPGGGATIGRIKRFMNSFDMSGDVVLFNNAPYAQLIEEGRSVTKAPAGMVRINTIRFDSILSKAIARHGDK